MSTQMQMAAGAAAVLLALLAIALLSQFSSAPLEAFAFYAFGGAMAGSSLAVALGRDIVRSAVWLLATLCAAAVLYLLLAATFLAAVQLIVYAGGILVLIVFGVMLTGRSPFLRQRPRPTELALAGGVGVVLLVALATMMLTVRWPVLPGAAPSGTAAPVAEIGTALLTTWLVPFELVSVLLLAVMIGAAYLARPERR